MKTITKTIAAVLMMLFAFEAQAQLIANAGTDVLVCIGNPVTLGGTPTAIGGTAPYTYAWSPATDLSCTTCPNPQATPVVHSAYSVTVTDNLGATAASTVSVIIDSFYIYTSSTTNVNCFGLADGSATIFVSSCGIPPFQYSIDNGLTYQASNVFQNLAPGFYLVKVKDATTATQQSSFTITQPTALQLSETHTNVLCYSAGTGTINLTVTGGTAPYTYLWSNATTTPQITNLLAGPYTVTVTDARGCAATLTVIISQPGLPLLIDSIAVTNINCNGDFNGSACAHVSGGTPLYTYGWSNGLPNNSCITNLAGGTYFLTVQDANFCTVATTATITEPAPLAIAITHVSNVSCNGGNNGAIDITVSGGTPNYSYLWSTGEVVEDITNWAGDYIVSVTDANGCSDTASATITEPTQLVIDSIITTNALCNGGSTGEVCVYASGGTPSTGFSGGYMFGWSNGQQGIGYSSCINNLIAAPYGLTVNDNNGCGTVPNTTVVVITEPTPLVIDSISITNATCAFGNDGQACVHTSGGTPYPFTSGLPPNLYAWSNATNDSCVGNLTIGVYSISVIDMNSCSVSATFTILQSTQDQCVFPGDADYNGVADNDDLLAIGLGYGTTGTARTQQDINWYGHPAVDWTDTLITGTNYKHIDCDGNGTINSNDTIAIIQNFGLTHAKNNDSAPWRAAAPALYVQLAPDTTHAGDTMYANLILGDAIIPAANVYGLAFTLNYDATVVDSTRTSAVFGNSWLGTSTDKISIAKDLKTTGELKCAITRIDHTMRSGNGQIGQVSFVITTDNINGKNFAYYNMHVWLSDVTMIDNQGNVLDINEGQDSSQVEFEPLSVGSLQLAVGSFKMQPNPATNEFTVYSSQLAINQIQLVDLSGRIISTHNLLDAKRATIDVANLANSIYMVQISSGKATVTKRLVIAR